MTTTNNKKVMPLPTTKQAAVSASTPPHTSWQILTTINANIETQIDARIDALSGPYWQNKVSVGGGTIAENPPFPTELSVADMKYLRARVMRENPKTKEEKGEKDEKNYNDRIDKIVQAQVPKTEALKAHLFRQYYTNAGDWIEARPDGTAGDKQIGANTSQKNAVMFDAVGNVNFGEEDFSETPFGKVWYEIAEIFWNMDSPKELQGTFDLNNDGIIQGGN